MTYSDWTNNTGGDEVVVNLEVEEDDGVFLSLTCVDVDLELLIEDDAAAQQFFRTVSEAKAKWDGAHL